MMHGHDRAARKSDGHLHGVVGVHRQVERPPRTRCTSKKEHDRRIVAPGHFGGSSEPHGVAGDVDQVARWIDRGNHESDDITEQRLDAGGTVSCRRRSDPDSDSCR